MMCVDTVIANHAQGMQRDQQVAGSWACTGCARCRTVGENRQKYVHVCVPCRREYCERVEDFLARRTRLAFLDVEAAEAAVNRVSVLRQ